jgi:hypothetical protein
MYIMRIKFYGGMIMKIDEESWFQVRVGDKRLWIGKTRERMSERVTFPLRAKAGPIGGAWAGAAWCVLSSMLIFWR